MRIIKKILLAVTLLGASPYANNIDGFDKVLNLQGITFHITASKKDGESSLHISPSGLYGDNSPIMHEIEGSIIDAEVADLNRDGSPEIYIYTVSDGSGSYGSLVAYSTNKKRSLSGIYLPPLEDDKENGQGYMGHDEFSIIDNVLVRRFPIYNEGDANCCPKGGKLQLSYKLVAGESGWQLKLTKRTLLK